MWDRSSYEQTLTGRLEARHGPLPAQRPKSWIQPSSIPLPGREDQREAENAHAPKDPKGKEPDATVVEGADGSTDEDEESVAFDKQLKDRLWDANDPDLTAMEHFHPQALPHLNLDQVFLFRCILYFAMASGCRINDDTCPMQI